MEISDYLISKEDSKLFLSHYTSMFHKDSWYPDDFFPKNYSLFYYVFPLIKIEDKENTHPNFQITNTTLLTKRGADSYMNWGKFLADCIQAFGDSQLFLRAADFMAPSEESIYSIQAKDFDFFLRENNLKAFNDKVNGHSMDDGSILFGDSNQWFYYSGEVFHENAKEYAQYLEFDAFGVPRDKVETFTSILTRSIKKHFSLSQSVSPELFFDQVVHNDRPIYKITLQNSRNNFITSAKDRPRY